MAAPAVLSRTPKPLARENTVLLNQQLRIAEANADLQRDISYILNFLDEGTPESASSEPHMTNDIPPQDTFLNAALGRRLSISAIRSTIYLSDELGATSCHHSQPFQGLSEPELVERAFRRNAPVFDDLHEPEDVAVVQMRDIELCDADDSTNARDLTTTNKVQPVIKKASVSPVLQKWLQDVDDHHDTEVTTKSQSKSQAHRAPQSPPKSQVLLSPPLSHATTSKPTSPRPNSNSNSSLTPTPHSSPRPKKRSVTPLPPSPILTTDQLERVSSGPEDDGDYVPSQAPRKRVKSSQSDNSGQEDTDSVKKLPKRARNQSSSNTKLYCLHIGCPSGSVPFTNVRDRNRHMEVHFPDREHPKCAVCHKPMSRPDSVKRHQNSVAGRSCRIALAGKMPCTIVKKPWQISPWKECLRMPPANDPLYPLAMEMKMQGRSAGVMAIS